MYNSIIPTLKYHNRNYIGSSYERFSTVIENFNRIVPEPGELQIGTWDSSFNWYITNTPRRWKVDHYGTVQDGVFGKREGNVISLARILTLQISSLNDELVWVIVLITMPCQTERYANCRVPFNAIETKAGRGSKAEKESVQWIIIHLSTLMKWTTRLTKRNGATFSLSYLVSETR